MSPIYLIPPDELIFPHPSEANPDGILGIGGDLRPERLLLAYRFGIFPWYGEGDPIIWWSPDPRLVLFPGRLKIAKSMRPYLNRPRFEWTVDRAFSEVIHRCGTSRRKGQDGTWILPEMVDAYLELHRMGYAHSVEVWLDGDLVGGLYGVSFDRVFCGESMFHRATNASKVCLVYLVERLRACGFSLLDTQFTTEHLEQFNIKEIPREEYLRRLSEATAIARLLQE